MIVMIIVHIYELIYCPSIAVVWEKEAGWCGRQNNGPQRCPHCDPGHLYVRLHGKGALRLQVEWRWLIIWPNNGIIQVSLMSSQGSLKQKEASRVRGLPNEKDSAPHFWLWSWRKGAISQEVWVIFTDGKKKTQRNDSPESPPSRPLFSPRESPFRLLSSRTVRWGWGLRYGLRY